MEAIGFVYKQGLLELRSFVLKQKHLEHARRRTLRRVTLGTDFGSHRKNAHWNLWQ